MSQAINLQVCSSGWGCVPVPAVSPWAAGHLLSWGEADAFLSGKARGVRLLKLPS